MELGLMNEWKMIKRRNQKVERICPLLVWKMSNQNVDWMCPLLVSKWFEIKVLCTITELLTTAFMRGRAQMRENGKYIQIRGKILSKRLRTLYVPRVTGYAQMKS